MGVLVFLMPALAVDHNEPKASPPAADFVVAGDLMEEVAEAGLAWLPGAGTDVK